MRGLEALQQGFSLETQLLRAQIFTKRLELRELLTDPNTKIDAIRSKSSEILEHQAKLEERSIEYLIKVKDILTAEQLKNWCPEQEFPFLRGMMQRPEFMGPMSPRKTPPQERPREE